MRCRAAEPGMNKSNPATKLVVLAFEDEGEGGMRLAF